MGVRVGVECGVGSGECGGRNCVGKEGGRGELVMIYPWVSSGCRSLDHEKGSAFMLFNAWIRMQNCRPR